MKRARRPARRRRSARPRREAEELARIARFLTETLDVATVGRRVVESVCGLFEVPAAGLRLREADDMLVLVAAAGEGPYMPIGHRAPTDFGIYRTIVNSGQPLRVPDVAEEPAFTLTDELAPRMRGSRVRSLLAVPLRVQERITGVLSIATEVGRVFADDEVALLQAFADQAAIAVNNAQAQQALTTQAERLRILHEIDRALIAEQAPVAIAEAVVFPLRDLLSVPRVIVNLFDLEAGQVEWLAAAGRRRQHLGPGVRYPIRLAGDVEGLRRGESQMIDVRSLLPSPDAEALLAAGLNVYMVVPMMVGGELIGSISVCDQTGPFAPEIIAIAQEVANQLGIAIAQARLHERVTRQAAELERRVEERTHELSEATADADRANRAKSEFLSRMSHELRTPLNAILGFGQLLEMDALSERQAEGVGHILRAGRHLLGLINEVLDISRIEAGRLSLSLEPVPVRETIAQAMQLVGPTATVLAVTLRVGAVDERLHVLADRQRLQQVLLNLLSNAVKYNRPRGTVTIGCERAGDERVRISVTDTGPGIAAEKLERLFVPFDRLGAEATGVEGTGLGLALSKSLVAAMSGTMDVRSEPGTGSTFSVELAVASAPEAAGLAAVAADGPLAAPARPQTILYIEDNLSNLRLVESILSRRPGVTVLSAMQGRVGLDLARHHLPDLVLLDRHLPDIPGEEVFRLLAEDPRTRAIPVVMLSADAILTGVQRLLDAGVRAYLTKPLDVRRLLDVIDETLEARDRRP